MSLAIGALSIRTRMRLSLGVLAGLVGALGLIAGLNGLGVIAPEPARTARPPAISVSPSGGTEAPPGGGQADSQATLAPPAKPAEEAEPDGETGTDGAPLEIGEASWYDLDSETASGEEMDGEAFTAAHRTLPLGTRVRVENLDNGRAVVVRINDRGPFAEDRIIDLSKAAAESLGIVKDGVAKVRVSGIGAMLSANGPDR
jgi:rare lipoprotein A